MKKLKNLSVKTLVLIIKGYQICISPYLPNTCRHLPTCSEYAIDAIQTLGPIKGTYKSILRIIKCNPLGSHGFDPVIKRK